MGDAWIIWSEGEPVEVKPTLEDAEWAAQRLIAAGRKNIHMSGPHQMFSDETTTYNYPYQMIRPSRP